MDDGRRSAGNFRDRLLNVGDITIQDFSNPWNFYKLFMSSSEEITDWCISNQLLASEIKCPVLQCNGQMVLKRRSGRVGEQTFRCNKNRNHERSSRIYSFFENSQLTISDIMMFVKSYLDGNSLLQCSKFSGIAYKSTAVNWASFMRELFKDYFQVLLKNKLLEGEIEIDESLFGRKVKYHKGNPNPGLRIWIFGMVDRATNSVIMYPVSNRSKETLIPIIQRHVAPGSTIYSDGWSAYCSLNTIGYQHFTVIHKHSFKKTYQNVETRELVEVHTNRIEGAWKHAKQHFKKMSGTKLSQFEGHLAEIMWRSHVKGNLYNEFFRLLTSVYTLQSAPRYLYTTPLFDTWDIQTEGVSTPLSEWSLEPIATDAESGVESDHEIPRRNNVISISSDDSPILPNPVASSSIQNQNTSNSQLFHDLFSGSSDEDTIVESPVESANSIPPVTSLHPNSGATKGKKLSETPTASASTQASSTKRKSLSVDRSVKSGKKSNRTDRVCHPKGYREVKSSRDKGEEKSKKINNYSKSAYKWDFSSSDEDFA